MTLKHPCAAQVVSRLEPFGARVLVARSKTTSADLDGMIAAADVVVLACAANAATTGLLDARRFGLMKTSATLVNVARGSVTVERDLYNALRTRQIAHAFVDVWYRYPEGPASATTRPGVEEWRDLPQDVLTMTPHASGWSKEQDTRKYVQIAENLDNLANATPLARVVTLGDAD